MITLGVCGFGFTGSGAVLDLLNDYEDVSVRNGEYGVVYNPDCLLDLRRAICNPCRFLSSDAAIPRFINFCERQKMSYPRSQKKTYQIAVDNFLKQLNILTWKGFNSNFWHLTNGLDFWLGQNIGVRVRRYYERYFNPIHYHILPERTMYYAYITVDKFNEAARQFLINMSNVGVEQSFSHIIALDQPFPANNPRIGFDFFENPKAIIVKRDPRDLYLIAKNALNVDARFIPSDNVEDFIRFYKGQMDSCMYNDGDDVMTINFEDLIYDNEATEKHIADFVGIKKKSIIGKKHFDPLVSINNTQMWLKYPQYEDDVRKISDELKDYLFDFNLFDLKPSFNLQSF